MKRKLLLVGSTVAVIALIFVACTKEDKQVPQSQLTTSSNATVTLRTTNNPYDQVGIDHNAALDSVAQLSGFPDSLPRTYAGTAIREYFISLNYDSITYISVDDALEQYDNTTSTISEIADELYNNSAITAAQQNYLYQFDTIMNQTDAANVKSDLEALENTILDDSIPSGDKRLLLGAISVGWHSTDYWYKATNESSHRWFGVTDPAGKPKWLADARGYIIGFTDDGACPCFCPGCHFSAGSYSGSIHSMAAAIVEIEN